MPSVIQPKALFIEFIRPAKAWKLVSRLLFLCLLPALQHSAYAQLPTCPDPWGSASNLYGIVFLEGTGMAKSPPYTQNVNQWVGFQAKMAAQPFACAWTAAPIAGLGSADDWIYVNDSFTDSLICGGEPPIQNYSWFGQGHGNSPQIQVGITAQSNIYGWGYGDNVTGTETDNGCINGTTSLPLVFGPLSGIEEQMLPMPASGRVLFGSKQFSDAPIDPGSTLQGNWQLIWLFSTSPDDMCDDCIKKLLHLSGSDLSIHNQDLGEDEPVIGTPFFLHYQSSRSFGRVGADAAAVQDAHNLGGWTLSVHHALDPLLQIYCVGGSCTPYAIVPKALFMGDGRVRSDDSVQAPVVYNGNLYVTDEDGSEVYEFSNGMHTRTLLPMTGAVRYTFGYDTFGRLTSVTDESNNVTTIQRDSNGNPTAIVGPFGQKTTLAVDGNGFLSQMTDPAGRVTKFTNSAAGLLTSLTDPKGNVYNYQYDSFGRLTQHSDPAGGFINLARTDNANGYSVLETTAMGRTSTAQVGFSSNSSQTARQFTNTWTNGLQATESKTQLAGQLSDSTTLPDGSSYGTSYGPDPRWGIQVPVLTSQTVTQGNVTMNINSSRSAVLGTPGNPFSLTSQTDTTTVNGRTYTTVFTASNLTYQDTSPVGRLVTSTVDAKERLSTMQINGLVATSFSYNSHGLLSAIKQGARQTTYAYDSKGRLASLTDPLGLKTTYTHDADGDLLLTTSPDGRAIAYTYDHNNNLTSVTPPGAEAHAFAFTQVNIPSSYTPPTVLGTGATTYAYDLDRDLKTVTRPDGETITYGHDSAGRLISIVTPTGTTTFTYDATTGDVDSANRGAEKISYSYNGPLHTKSTWKGTVAGNVSRKYNDNFWVSSESVGGGSSIALTYDKDGLLTKAGPLAVKRNTKNGLITGTTLGVATDSRTYDSFGELISYTASANGIAVYSVTYTRDADGRVTGKTETINGTGNTYSYTYDLAGRLTSAVKNSTTDTYTYDSNSNRLSGTTASGTSNGTYDAQDRLLTYGTAVYTYTANGELASQKIGSKKTTYKYDVLGNLIAATLPSGTKLAYIIDAKNRRVGKEVNGVLQTGFLYDGDQIVAQLNGSNVVVSQFVYATGSASPDYMVTGGITYRIISDQLGSPVLVVNTSTGAVAEQVTYDEFGNVLSDANPGFQPFGFAGGLYDQDLKLVRFGARDYNPSIGRWTAKDPILFRGGDTNLYGYVLDDPVNLRDPSGQGFWQSVWDWVHGVFGKEPPVINELGQLASEDGVKAAKGEVSSFQEQRATECLAETGDPDVYHRIKELSTKDWLKEGGRACPCK
ncbi:MAG: RHS repeat-associated core domain-containing protein [Terriglobales bacterium]